MTAPELVALARAGDAGAIHSLLASAQPDIRRYARRACRLEDVDDAVQDTLWLVSRRIGALRATAAFGGWVFAIVKRECLRLARAARPWLPLATAEVEQPPAVPQDAELRADLTAAIQSLPEHYRSVVILRDIEERTIGEVADAEGISREAAKARLRRARLMMRDYLLP
jgi:RNA polymerase sigma factor (sigma-70 family)